METEASESAEIERQDNPIEAGVNVLRSPASTLRALARQRPVAWALLVVVVISLLSALASGLVALGGDQQQVGQTGRLFGDAAGVGFVVGLAVIAPLFAIIGVAFVAGVVHLASRALGGRAPYASLFVAVGFSQVPSIFQVPVQLLALAGAGAAVIAGVVNFALAIWVLVLVVIATRETYDFSTARAVAAVLIPIVVLIVLFALLAAFLVAAIFQGVSQTGALWM